MQLYIMNLYVMDVRVIGDVNKYAMGMPIMARQLINNVRE